MLCSFRTFQKVFTTYTRCRYHAVTSHIQGKVHVRATVCALLLYLNNIQKKLQTIYLMLYKRQIKKTAKIKNISTNVSVSLYI